MQLFIESSVPFFNESDKKEVINALETSHGKKRYQYQEKLREELLEHYPGYKSVFFSQCTNAMLTTLAELASRSDKNEIIIPALSWVSTASAVILAGLTPVFVDVERYSGCIDLIQVEENINERTLAVMTVGFFGNMNDPEQLINLKKKYKSIYWLEDAAESMGSKESATGIMAGNFGDISFLSFHATKLINAGQGGVALFRDSELAGAVAIRGHHGIDMVKTGKYYWSEMLGYNFAWSDVSAALAYSQLLRINELIAERVKYFKAYSKSLISLRDGVNIQKKLNNIDQVYWLPYFEFSDFENEVIKHQFMDKALKRNIAFRPLFYPLVEMPPFRKYANIKSNISINIDAIKEKFQNSFMISRRGVSLPTGAIYSEKTVSSVNNFLLEELK